jgi:hypothetical protein
MGLGAQFAMLAAYAPIDNLMSKWAREKQFNHPFRYLAQNLSSEADLIHTSETLVSAQQEVGRYFDPAELFDRATRNLSSIEIESRNENIPDRHESCRSGRAPTPRDLLDDDRAPD